MAISVRICVFITWLPHDASNGIPCLLWPVAGPPYEDLAFRIVNKEWEFSHKRGDPLPSASLTAASPPSVLLNAWLT